jgi:ATP-binding protein involved in chromosome partitioning
MSTTERSVISALRHVVEPELQRDLIALNMVRDIKADENSASFTIVLSTFAYPMREEIKDTVFAELAKIGVTNVDIKWDVSVPTYRSASGPDNLPGIKNIIAVASNKGGVGKSTVATNLAVCLARTGAAVGLIDADITGPNLPTMFGLPAGFQANSEQGLHPIERHGVKIISLGFLLPANSPVVWRGPMIGTGVRQLLHDVDWGELDYLLVDLPPGTSDATMSLAQEAPVAGAVIVSTPQQVALEDAGKAIAMFEKLNVSVFGIVENMSYFISPDTEHRLEIFGHGGARIAAEEQGLDFLGEIPLAIELREAGDKGEPFVEFNSDSPVSQSFEDIAGKIAAKLSILTLIEI